MFDTQNNLHDRGVLDVLKILSANGESGRLEMQAGTTEGFFFVKDGHLVDARVGDLTGFQAVNAVAAMRDARFTFDPTAVPPSASSITSSERVVLKQFFGIDAFESNDFEEPPMPVYSDTDEVTIETSRIPVGALLTPVEARPVPVEPVPPPVEAVPAQVEPLPAPVEPLAAPVTELSSSRPFYRSALVLGLLLVALIAAAAVAMRNQYRERVLPAAAATAEQPQAPSVAEESKPSTPVAAEIKTDKPAAPVATAAKAEKPSAPVAQPSDQPLVAGNLSGKWTVVNTVQKTSYRSFQNMKIGFDLSIDQNGNSFTGRGVKVSENGRTLPAGSRTPIQVKGSINGDRIEATFFEDGSLRKTNGRIEWRIDKDGALNGTFVSNAAGTSGKSAAAKKEL